MGSRLHGIRPGASTPARGPSPGAPDPHRPQKQTRTLAGSLGGLTVQPPKPPYAAPQAFNVVFEKAIQKTTPAKEVKQRVMNLTDEITYSVYMYTARGLFERDKLIFLAQVAFQVGLASLL